MKTYRGFNDRTGGHKNVFIIEDGKTFTDRRRLDPKDSLKIRDHSPSGFNWGYGGSGPAQLALALLFDVTDDAHLSAKLHQQFKWEFVARWGDQWEMTEDEIRGWVQQVREQEQN